MLYYLTETGLKEVSADTSHRDAPLVINDERGIARLRLDARLLFAADESDAVSAFGTLEEDDTHLYAPYRALSAVMIDSRCIDFSREGVLKASYRLLKGQTVYANHDHDVNAWVGITSKSEWEEASGSRPAGINATLKIPKKHNERIVDGVKEGAIHSTSVDVLFEFEKSHPDLDGFWWQLGKKVDGAIVRLIAAKIISYEEISLVWQGADRYAKRLFNVGEGIGPEAAGSTDPQKTAEAETGGEEEMKLSRRTALALGLRPELFGLDRAESVELSESAFELLAGEMERRNDAMKVATGNIALALGLSADAAPDEIIGRAKECFAKGGVADVALESLRAECLKFARIAEGEGDEKKINTALEKSIIAASFEDATSLLEMYRMKAESLAPAKCTSCGAALSRGSANRGGVATDDECDETKFKM